MTTVWGGSEVQEALLTLCQTRPEVVVVGFPVEGILSDEMSFFATDFENGAMKSDLNKISSNDNSPNLSLGDTDSFF